MKIAVSSTESQWNELTACSNKIEWIKVDNENDFSQHENADAFFILNSNGFDLDFSKINKPVFINAVAVTLKELNTAKNIFRINGWNGFLYRPVWEIAGIINNEIIAVCDELNKKIKVVADEPGLVAARIIAMIINEAYFALADEVSSREEINTAMKLGTNYPFGPFEWASIIDHKNILELLQKLTITNKCYQPAPLLIKEVEENNL